MALRAPAALGILLILGGCKPNASSATAPPAAVPLPALVTGANLRPVGDPRRGYGTRTARRTMERLQNLGVNTVAVLLEGRMNDLEDTTIRPAPGRDLAAARRALLDANAAGLATVLIPHLYLEDGAWRGDITFSSDAQRDAWWASYAAFLVGAARIAEETGTTVLALGVELKALSAKAHTRAEIHALARQIRREYRGLLTYGANWDEADQVVFWDAVDLTGINGYFPLLPDPVRGAEGVARRLSALAERTNRGVLVLEVGYRSSPLTHLKPWEWPEHVDAAVDDEAQAGAWAAVLTQWLGAPGVRGLMLWVVPTDPDDPASEPRHGFSPLNKPAEAVIGRVFRGARRGA